MTAVADAQVIFTPSGRRGRVPAGTTVLDAARGLGVDIDSVCGARGICGRCAVTPAFGSFPKHGITAEPVAPQRRPARSRRPIAPSTGWPPTAGCRARPGSSATRVIDVPPESQVHRQVVRKDLDARPFELDPVVRLHTVDVTPPDLATPTGDLGRLFDALRERVGPGRPARRPRPSSARSSRPSSAGAYRVTVAVHGGPRRHRGLAGLPRPRVRGRHRRRLDDDRRPPRRPDRRHDPGQRRGHEPADPLRRGPDEPGQLRDDARRRGGGPDRGVRKALDGLLATLANRAGIKRAEILELALVGNPIMHHLLLGIDPTPARLGAVRAGRRHGRRAAAPPSSG